MIQLRDQSVHIREKVPPLLRNRVALLVQRIKLTCKSIVANCERSIAVSSFPLAFAARVITSAAVLRRSPSRSAQLVLCSAALPPL